MPVKNNQLLIKDFTDLKTWQEGHRLVLMIYRLTKSFSKEEKYALIDQMRRSAVSITSNVAEGFGRRTYRDKVQFFYLAQGSLTELKNQLIICRDVSYINRSDYFKIVLQINLVHKLLQGLITKSKTFF